MFNKKRTCLLPVRVISVNSKYVNHHSSCSTCIIYGNNQNESMNGNQQGITPSELMSLWLFAQVKSVHSKLASDVVGKLKIIDLSSNTTLDMLRGETNPNEFDAILGATRNVPVTLSSSAQHLIAELEDTPLSVQELRNKLHRVGYQKDFDPIVHQEATFIEVTFRYFLDLMNSPNSLLNVQLLERTSATYLIIYLVNQLFLPNNDVIELGWLEREFYATDKTKFDGALFSVCNMKIALVFIEFSGGINDKTSPNKNSRDITKLYSFMQTAMIHSNS